MSPHKASPPARRRNFHGRRRGRPLRARRAKLMEDLLPRVGVALPASGRLDITALFPARPRDLWLEIGFGAGEHLAWQAARHPEVGFLGAEFFVNGIASLLRLIADHGLNNVRVFQGDARDLLEALPSDALGRAFILFPDPWPKTRHHGRRLIQRETLDELARVLRDGAELRMATDDADYLTWMLEQTTAHPAFCWLARSAADWRHRPSDWPPTRYEGKAHRRGAKPAFLRFARRPRSG